MYPAFLLLLLVDNLRRPFGFAGKLRPLLWMGVALSLFGVLFKILHWAGANILILFGAVLVSLFYTIKLLSTPATRAEDHVKTLFVVAFTIGMMMRILHWKYAYETLSVSGIAFLGWLLLLGYRYVKCWERGGH